MDKVLNKITNIFKSRYCSRKNYWIFFGISSLCLIILLPLGDLINSFYSYGFRVDRYKDFLYFSFFILNIILQIKRLRDANISPYALIIYVLVFFSYIFNTNAFNYVLYIVLLILLLLPTQRPPTTNLVKGEK